MDKRVAQKRAHRETDEERGQFANACLVHREGNEASKRNEAYSDDAGKGKNDGRHSPFLGGTASTELMVFTSPNAP